MSGTNELAVGLWESLRNYLAVSESDDGETVTITNTSPASPLQPTVVFTNVVVNVAGGSKPETSSVSRLRPGEEFKVQFEKPLQSDSLIDVTASVDLDEYSKISVLSPSTTERMRALAKDWFNKFDQFGVFDRLAKLIGSIPEVSENSTVAEMKQLESLPEAMTAIFSEFNDSVGQHYPIDRHLSPHESVREAARLLGQPIRRISKAAETGDVDTIRFHVEKLRDLPDLSIEFMKRKLLMVESLESSK